MWNRQQIWAGASGGTRRQAGLHEGELPITGKEMADWRVEWMEKDTQSNYADH